MKKRLEAMGIQILTNYEVRDTDNAITDTPKRTLKIGNLYIWAEEKRGNQLTFVPLQGTPDGMSIFEIDNQGKRLRRIDIMNIDNQLNVRTVDLISGAEKEEVIKKNQIYLSEVVNVDFQIKDLEIERGVNFKDLTIDKQTGEMIKQAKSKGYSIGIQRMMQGIVLHVYKGNDVVGRPFGIMIGLGSIVLRFNPKWENELQEDLKTLLQTQK